MINDQLVHEVLARASRPDAGRVREILAHAADLQGLSPDEAAALSHVSDPALRSEIFAAARQLKDTIYGARLVLFAPLYVSNLCGNDCAYCAFRVRNRALKRRALTQDELRSEVEVLLTQGHKRVLLVAGEAYPNQGFRYILDAVHTIYDARVGPHGIRRVNVNVAPLELDDFIALKACGIGTYQLFQETYHRGTYASVHLGGRKRDYDWRVTAIDRALQAGIDDVGVGVLFGLYDWRYEVQALLQHVGHLEATFGVGPHTISIPRLEPASGADLASNPPAPVSDDDFRLLIAVLRLAVPYTGLILSTRERPDMRREAFALGVSQISAGSRTNPAGYAEGEDEAHAGQFSLGDHRTLDEVVRDVAEHGYIPSFCTACYRMGRTGQDFMDLAKPGAIKGHCDPNGVSTFAEYLQDFATPETRAVGERAIAAVLAGMAEGPRLRAEAMLAKVRAGTRDVMC
jgi:2-iminoacetate synthase